LRDFLNQKPNVFEELSSDRPGGPLALSYIRGNYLKMTESRYDFIYVSPEFRVESVEYLYEESVNAGSDHALVLVGLEIGK
jgi:endonuclease/exonuclease/phosphatase family metal-dependent hydrolase